MAPVYESIALINKDQQTLRTNIIGHTISVRNIGAAIFSGFSFQKILHSVSSAKQLVCWPLNRPLKFGYRQLLLWREQKLTFLIET